LGTSLTTPASTGAALVYSGHKFTRKFMSRLLFPRLFLV